MQSDDVVCFLPDAVMSGAVTYIETKPTIVWKKVISYIVVRFLFDDAASENEGGFARLPGKTLASPSVLK